MSKTNSPSSTTVDRGSTGGRKQNKTLFSVEKLQSDYHLFEFFERDLPVSIVVAISARIVNSLIKQNALKPQKKRERQKERRKKRNEHIAQMEEKECVKCSDACKGKLCNLDDEYSF